MYAAPAINTPIKCSHGNPTCTAHAGTATVSVSYGTRKEIMVEAWSISGYLEAGLTMPTARKLARELSLHTGLTLTPRRRGEEYSGPVMARHMLDAGGRRYTSYVFRVDN